MLFKVQIQERSCIDMQAGALAYVKIKCSVILLSPIKGMKVNVMWT